MPGYGRRIDFSGARRANFYGRSRERNAMFSATKPLHTLHPLLMTVLLAAAACSSSDSAGPKTVEGKSPDGTVEMTQLQAAYIGSGSGGHGTLFYKGQSYTFNVGGVGIGGIGVSTIDAKG